MEPQTNPRHVTNRRVEFVDTDMAGIVHFTNFFRYMEQAEAEFFRAYGFVLASPLVKGEALGWPRVAASCSFKAPAYHNDVLEVRIFVRRRGFKSLTLQFQFWRGTVLIATGQIKTAYCRFRPGQPIESLEIPSEFDAMLGPYDPVAAGRPAEDPLADEASGR
jgi:YbgC/YbaW family acyl-CoA thioester hydrolase